MNANRDLGIPVPDYTDENVSDKVVKIIQSYTGVVNKMVWRKELQVALFMTGKVEAFDEYFGYGRKRNGRYGSGQ